MYSRTQIGRVELGRVVFSRGQSVPGLPPVTGLVIDDEYQDKIDLAWDAYDDADGYSVERSPAGAGTWTEVAAVGTNSATLTYTVADTQYDFRVIAFVGAEDSQPSNIVTAWSPLLFCTMTAANGTGIAGVPRELGAAAYTQDTLITGTSQIQIDTNRAVRSTGTGAKIGVYDTGQARNRQEIDIITTGTTYAVLTRHLNGGNHFAFYVGPGSGGSIILYKRTSAGTTLSTSEEVARNDNLGTLSGTYKAIVENHAGELKINVIGYGTLNFSTTDYNTNTKVGFYFAVSSGSHVGFDNHAAWRLT